MLAQAKEMKELADKTMSKVRTMVDNCEDASIAEESEDGIIIQMGKLLVRDLVAGNII